MTNCFELKTKSAKVLLCSALCFTLLSISACLETPTFEANKSIPSQAWKSRDLQHYKVHITNTTKPFNISINLRHSLSYKRSSISLLISEKSPKNTERTINSTITLAKEDGRWLGVGTGNIFSNQVYILKNYQYPDTGIYHYSISHNMNQDPLNGILTIGLKIQEAN